MGLQGVQGINSCEGQNAGQVEAPLLPVHFCRSSACAAGSRSLASCHV